MSLKGKKVGLVEDNLKICGNRCKQAMFVSTREVCGSVRMGVKNPKCVLSLWWNIEAAWKEVLAASDEEAEKRYVEAYREKGRKVKRCIYLSKRK